MATTSTSLRPASAIARRILRPIRPNPLMRTRTVMNYSRLNRSCYTYSAWSHLPKFGKRRAGDCFCGNSKLFIQFLVGRAGAKRVHADKYAIGSDDGIPALPHGGFHANSDASTADDRT